MYAARQLKRRGKLHSLDAAPADAPATSTSAAAGTDDYSPALPPTPLLAGVPTGTTYVTPEAGGDDTSTVSPALRQRIHDGKYVELGLLLNAADKISDGKAASFQLVNSALRDTSSEVKRSTVSKAVNRYVNESGAMTPKVRAQLQLQMGAACADKGILCVDNPSFESSDGIIIVDGELGRQFIEPLRDDVSHMLLVE